MYHKSIGWVGHEVNPLGLRVVNADSVWVTGTVKQVGDAEPHGWVSHVTGSAAEAVEIGQMFSDTINTNVMQSVSAAIEIGPSVHLFGSRQFGIGGIFPTYRNHLASDWTDPASYTPMQAAEPLGGRMQFNRHSLMNGGTSVWSVGSYTEGPSSSMWIYGYGTGGVGHVYPTASFNDNSSCTDVTSDDIGGFVACGWKDDGNLQYGTFVRGGFPDGGAEVRIVQGGVHSVKFNSVAYRTGTTYLAGTYGGYPLLYRLATSGTDAAAWRMDDLGEALRVRIMDDGTPLIAVRLADGRLRVDRGPAGSTMSTR